MAEIKKVDFSKFLQNQDYTLHSLLIAEIDKLTDAQLNELHAAYKSKFQVFDETLKIGGKNPNSLKLSDLDKLQDNAYTGLMTITRAMLYHTDPEKVEIATQVDIILKKYGNPCRLPYLQENSVIKNLIHDLEAFDNKEEEDDRPVIESLSLENVTNRLEKIGLREWVDQLKLKNEEFMALYAVRNEEEASIVTGATKEARNAADAAYYDVVRRINALAELNGEADYLTVINNINQLLDKELASLALHRTTTKKRNDKNKDEGDDDDRPVM